MGAITKNTLVIPRGDTHRESIDVFTEDGQVYEIQENDTLTLRVKRNLCDEEPCITKEIKGSNNFHFEPKDTENLPFGDYVYSVRILTAEGDKYTLLNKEPFVIEEVV